MPHMSSTSVLSRKPIQLIQNAFGSELAGKVFLNLAPKYLALPCAGKYPIFHQSYLFLDIPGHRIPVKCSLKNFDRENDYIFLVRGKDQHGRVGEFSEFSLAKKSN